MVIAAISVVALGADNLVRLSHWVWGNESANFTARIIQASPDSLLLTLDNDGPGSVIISGTAVCDVYQTKTSQQLWVPSTDNPNTYFTMRYPRPDEIVARTAFHYGTQNKSEIIPPGTFKQIELPLRDISPQDIPQEFLKDKTEVKSPCTMMYRAEDGDDGATLDILRDIEISWFAMDQEDVVAAYDRFYERVEKAKADKAARQQKQ